MVSGSGCKTYMQHTMQCLQLSFAAGTSCKLGTPHYDRLDMLFRLHVSCIQVTVSWQDARGLPLHVFYLTIASSASTATGYQNTVSQNCTIAFSVAQPPVTTTFFFPSQHGSRCRRIMCGHWLDVSGAVAVQLSHPLLPAHCMCSYCTIASSARTATTLKDTAN